MPVTLASGLPRLVTRPPSSGSLPVYTIGMVLVAALPLPTGLPNRYPAYPYIARAHIELIDELPAERAGLLSLADSAKA